MFRSTDKRSATGSIARLIGAVAPLLLVVWILLSPPATRAQSGDRAKSSPTTREEVARLKREAQILQSRYELATSDTFYLELDPASSRLDLRFKGALLQQYQLLGMEVGIPRMLFRPRALPPEWQGRVWQLGNLDPPRQKQRSELTITTLGDTAYADSVQRSFGVPLTPEQLYPVPHRYHVRYDGGLSLEVRFPAGTDSVKPHQSIGRSVASWWADLVSAIDSQRGDRVRLRIVLSPDEAKSLYRALPPDTRLLVLPAHEPVAGGAASN